MEIPMLTRRSMLGLIGGAIGASLLPSKIVAATPINPTQLQPKGICFFTHHYEVPMGATRSLYRNGRDCMMLRGRMDLPEIVRSNRVDWEPFELAALPSWKMGTDKHAIAKDRAELAIELEQERLIDLMKKDFAFAFGKAPQVCFVPQTIKLTGIPCNASPARNGEIWYKEIGLIMFGPLSKSITTEPKIQSGSN
jgi:hypothetical protein